MKIKIRARVYLTKTADKSLNGALKLAKDEKLVFWFGAPYASRHIRNEKVDGVEYVYFAIDTNNFDKTKRRLERKSGVTRVVKEN